MNDLLVYNARVRTLESSLPTAEAVLVRDGRIARLGASADLLADAGSARRLDAGGRPVLPGFMDSHVHFWRTGLMEQMLDLRPLRSIPEVLAAIRGRAAELPAGALLMARGFQDTKMAENRYPTRAEMDAAAPAHVLYLLHNNGHSCAVNSRALAFVDPPSGAPGLEVEPSTGEATGVIREKLAFQAQSRLLTLLDPSVRTRCLAITTQMALRAGATTVHCLEGGRLEGDPDVQDFLAHQAELPLNTLLYYQITDVEKVAALGLPRIGGCVLVDGSPAAHTGALFEPYTDRPDSVGPTYWQQDELDAWVWQAHSRGMQVVVHATSERAIDQILTAYERAQARLPRPDPRHRVDHFYFPRRQEIERAARLGVGGGVQPAFEEAFREMYLQRLGPERLGRVHPYRWHLDAGVVIGGGSDSFVTPIDPLRGMHAAVNHSIPNQRITPEEALRLFTVNDAYLGFEEEEAGTLRVGKRGDLVVLSGDPLAVPPETIRDLRVDATVVRGQVVFEA